MCVVVVVVVVVVMVLADGCGVVALFGETFVVVVGCDVQYEDEGWWLYL